MPRSSRDEEFSAFVQTRRNDLKDLLELALTDGHSPDPGQRADPGADLARGRRLLRRRRLAGLAGVTAAVLCAALVPLALQGHAPAAAARPAQSFASTVPAGPGKIALVAWEGTQPPGYRVSKVPKGWVVQGSNPYRLTIAPAHDPSTSPDDFIGKLVVMLQSRDVTSPPTHGTPQPVNGRSGMFDVQGDTQILTFQIAGEQWVVIQAPVSLGWDSAELAQFASGVQVLVTAQQGRG